MEDFERNYSQLRSDLKNSYNSKSYILIRGGIIIFLFTCPRASEIYNFTCPEVYFTCPIKDVRFRTAAMEIKGEIPLACRASHFKNPLALLLIY